MNNQSTGPQTDPIASTGRRFQYSVQTEDTGHSFPTNVQIGDGHIFQSNSQTVLNNNQVDLISGYGRGQGHWQKQ